MDNKRYTHKYFKSFVRGINNATDLYESIPFALKNHHKLEIKVLPSENEFFSQDGYEEGALFRNRPKFDINVESIDRLYYLYSNDKREIEEMEKDEIQVDIWNEMVARMEYKNKKVFFVLLYFREYEYDNSSGCIYLTKDIDVFQNVLLLEKQHDTYTIHTSIFEEYNLPDLSKEDLKRKKIEQAKRCYDFDISTSLKLWLRRFNFVESHDDFKSADRNIKSVNDLHEKAGHAIDRIENLMKHSAPDIKKKIGDKALNDLKIELRNIDRLYYLNVEGSLNEKSWCEMLARMDYGNEKIYFLLKSFCDIEKKCYPEYSRGTIRLTLDEDNFNFILRAADQYKTKEIQQLVYEDRQEKFKMALPALSCIKDLEYNMWRSQYQRQNKPEHPKSTNRQSRILTHNRTVMQYRGVPHRGGKPFNSLSLLPEAIASTSSTGLQQPSLGVSPGSSSLMPPAHHTSSSSSSFFSSPSKLPEAIASTSSTGLQQPSHGFSPGSSSLMPPAHHTSSSSSSFFSSPSTLPEAIASTSSTGLQQPSLGVSPGSSSLMPPAHHTSSFSSSFFSSPSTLPEAIASTSSTGLQQPSLGVSPGSSSLMPPAHHTSSFSSSFFSSPSKLPEAIASTSSTGLQQPSLGVSPDSSSLMPPAHHTSSFSSSFFSSPSTLPEAIASTSSAGLQQPSHGFSPGSSSLIPPTHHPSSFSSSFFSSPSLSTLQFPFEDGDGSVRSNRDGTQSFSMIDNPNIENPMITHTSYTFTCCNSCKKRKHDDK
nr:MAG: hypothetical protein [Metapenaeopsis lamellata majanivirus]